MKYTWLLLLIPSVAFGQSFLEENPTLATLLSTAGILLGIFVLLTLYLSFYIVRQQSIAVVQRFGKFVRLTQPGLHLKTPWIEWIAGKVNLRIQQLNVKIETKTADNVFVQVVVSVQYFVLPDKVYDAFYKLDNFEQQVSSFVFDVVRARVPKILLDDVFEKKDEVADAVKQELSQVMDDFGYGIIKALVTDIDPDAKVKESMNEINASTRHRAAAQEKGEADKILRVKAAEAEAQSMALQGKGIADQRRAILEGLGESIDTFQKNIPGAKALDVMQLVLLVQYFDTLKEIGASSKSNAILLPHSPGGLTDLSAQLRTALITANHMSPNKEETS
jgi:regulator of protease activity HflC (stomatin/prohibitin superfamily)